jgi:hypothetical protein
MPEQRLSYFHRGSMNKQPITAQLVAPYSFFEVN